MGKIKKRAGFTLIEVTIAIFILIVIVASVLMLLSSSYASLRESEAKNIAKNIGSYTVEYIRSRNVTVDNLLGHDPSELGNDSSHYYPGLVDLWDSPVNSNGQADEGASDKYINLKPALPNETYSAEPRAFYYSLQGYVSLGDFDYLSSSDPSPEDPNAKIDSNDIYHDKATCSIGNFHGNRYIMRFPFNSTINNGANPNPDAIKNFSAGSTYIPMIYNTTDPHKIDPTKPEYDSHYTNTLSDKSKTMDYNGFRVLTSIAARAKEDESNPGHPLPHVQYFDVKVTVLWVTGGDEHEYSLATQIVTY